jgi:Zn-dependent M28 family amino/carboxypeptidase
MVRTVNQLLLPLFILCCFSSSAQLPLTDSIIHPDSCRRIVETLAADSFMGRYTGSPMGEQAGKFIAEEFSKAGCAPGGNDGSFFIPFTFFKDSEYKKASNVVAVLPGKTKPGEWVIFSAHYDHIGTKSTPYASFTVEKGKPEKSDTIYNGANDNASGVTALILLARYFATVKNNERTIVFAAFSGEELGLFGSMHIANVMNNFDSVVAMINMDMVGVSVSKKNKNPYITGSQYSNLRGILNKRLYEKAPEKFGKEFFQKDIYKSEKLFTRSDNYWFAMKGVPAHTVIATHPRNQYYHSLNDEPGTLDYELMAKIINALAIGSGGMIDGTKSPNRINSLNIIGR